ncbi:T9SS type A sorting domain-containing protein [Candidatus Kapabacteria bacterium]|nr:T9SS type A sorting domain-containing protein [Candidatus Kapabacteria bacterium]
MNKNIIILILLSLSITAKARDFYWVNGSGKWHAFFEHWAFDSGGNSQEHGQVPGTEDNVYFDDNSFRESDELIVEIEADAVTRNFDFTRITDPNKRVIINHFNGTPFSIYGSVLLTSQVEINSNSIIIMFSSDDDFIFQTAGNTYHSLEFKSENANWNIIDGFKTKTTAAFSGNSSYNYNDSLFIGTAFISNNGNHDFNDIYLTCNDITFRENTKQIQLNETEIIVRSRLFEILNNSDLFDADNSTITLLGIASILICKDHTFNNVEFDNFNNSDSPNFAKLYGNGEYRKLSINTNLEILQNNSFDEIEITKGHSVYILPNTNQTINDKFTAIGDCDAGIYLTTREFKTATFTSESAVFETDYLHIESIVAKGGADFNANNSYDIDDNSGWNFDNYTPRTLYWVNGSGDWNDKTHWSASSGGNGGECIPSALDDVVIDDNSSLDNGIIRFSTSLIFAKNFDTRDFSGSVVFNNEKYFRIYGSLWLGQNNSFSRNNHKLIFSERFSDAEILTGGTIIPPVEMKDQRTNWSFLDEYTGSGEILFRGGNSVYDLLGNMTAPIMTFTNGTLNTNGYLLNLIEFKVQLGTEEINFFDSYVFIEKDFRFQNNQFVFNEGTSEIFLTGDISNLETNSYQFYNVTFQNDTRFISNIFSDGIFNKLTVSKNLFIKDNITADSVLFSAGFTTRIDEGRRATFNEMVEVDGNCNEYVFLQNTGTADSYFLMDGAEVNANYLVLQNITAEGDPPYLINNAVDLGNNEGWNFINANGRELYWVGGDGEWSDENHWSITSGGTIGECPPSAFDIAIFDELSSSGVLNLSIETPVAFCKDLIIKPVADEIIINNSQPLRLFGSLYLQESVSFLDYNSPLQFYGNNDVATISGMKSMMPLTQVYGTSQDYTFENELNFNNHFQLFGSENRYQINTNIWGSKNYYVYSGIVNSNSNSFTFNENIFLRSGGDVEVNMGSSTFNTRGMFYVDNAVINSDNSLVLFESTARVELRTPTLLNDVIFNLDTENYSNINGSSSTFKKLVANGNLNFNGSNSYDSLFFNAGTTYITNSGNSQTINDYWFLRGNQCFPVVLESNDPDHISYYQEEGIVSGDFLQLKNIKAGGNAVFYAGRSSDDFENSNTNWEFENSPGYIYGLGKDSIMCPGELLIPVNFNGAKEYIWSNGVTGDRYEITRDEEVTIEAIYGRDCIFYDTMYVRLLEDVEFYTDDGIVCSPGEAVDVNIDPDNDAGNLTVSWSPTEGISDPNSKNVTIVNDAAQDYVITIENGFCTTSNTVSYLIVDEIVPDISFDGTYLISNVKTGNQWFLEGEELVGETGDKIAPTEEGSYSVRVELNGCISSPSDSYFYDDPDRADIVIKLPVIEAAPGDIVNVPIEVSIRNPLIREKVDNIIVDLTYNGRVAYNSFGVISDDITSLAEFDLTDQNEITWGNYILTAMLSTDVETPLDAINVSGFSSSYSYEVIPGTLIISGICEEDGLRLFDDTELPFNVEISPNPVNKNLVITLSLIDESNIELSIIDINGNSIKVLDNIYLKPGLYQKSYNIDEISSGAYFLNLRNKGRSKTIRFLINK